MRIATASEQRQIGPHQPLDLDSTGLIEFFFRLLAAQCVDIPFGILSRAFIPIALHHGYILLSIFASHVTILSQLYGQDTHPNFFRLSSTARSLMFRSKWEATRHSWPPLISDEINPDRSKGIICHRVAFQLSQCGQV